MVKKFPYATTVAHSFCYCTHIILRLLHPQIWDRWAVPKHRQLPTLRNIPEERRSYSHIFPTFIFVIFTHLQRYGGGSRGRVDSRDRDGGYGAQGGGGGGTLAAAVDESSKYYSGYNINPN
jgi:hypothetical protein